jgi:hypothetical protein
LVRAAETKAGQTWVVLGLGTFSLIKKTLSLSDFWLIKEMLIVNVFMAFVCRIEKGFQEICKEQHII